MLKGNLGLKRISSPICYGERREKWLKDLEFIEKELPKRHKNLFFELDSKTFYSQLDEIKNDIDELSDEKIIVRLAILIASIKDGHSSLVMKFENMYPLELFCFDDGIFVTRANESYSKYVGCELTHINGFAMDEIISRIGPCISADNHQQFKNRLVTYLLIPEVLKGHDIIHNQALFTFRKGRERLMVSIEPLKIQAIKLKKPRKTMLHLSNQDQNYWYAYNKENQLLYFQYNTYDQTDLSFRKFNKEMFGLIDRNKVKKLVVDLRHNEGGKSWLLNPFFRALRTRPHLNNKNGLFLIIGRKSFSSAMMDTLKFMNDTQACLVGEATGGSPNAYGDVRYLKLTNNHLKLVYSTQYFNFMKGDFRTIEPDILIPSFSRDYFNNHDRALEALFTRPKHEVNFVKHID